MKWPSGPHPVPVWHQERRQVNKQILAMNKHIETLLASLAENARTQAEVHQDVPTYNNQDTQKLVRAIINGEGLRPSRTAAQSEGGAAAATPGGPHMGVRTPAAMTSPQQRR
ncbi:unnamed protein product [Gongylonema pulchrum]|uniref:Elf4 domain-containing protein n=1 Tax=Gongylonema pulchrum TaxID=637853 RepID=A0A183EGN0_9BILA|nr:unnamed protein product [Gongylonema pulchrum]